MLETIVGLYLMTAATASVGLLYLGVHHAKRIADVLEVSHEADILGVKAARAAGLTPATGKPTTEGLDFNG